MWHIYILECKDKTFYTGITTNLKRRLEEHNTSGLGAKYTKGRRPVKLVYSIRKKGKPGALKEEYRLKKLSRVEKIKIINKKNKKK
ncbi:endonuclease [Candidatus Falkowbacteria bacterium CG11_big_fil_rev_8_21_14_0_20_39_10]|uniref:Endonuclease n=1 Tax=Candidatus Falkowbacteria bacterium CG11_big_fil_rev_8_21_14_0_20_39_10 TaxID=1974570 RepID=A0A2M6KAD2_9BACT|nr:MAG: endonuclease [Candidatus Falkowbacteria bacterium CG11_big_fil_rev_8_21_14_0_20_39_10]